MLINFGTLERYILGLQEGEESLPERFFSSQAEVPNVYEGNTEVYQRMYSKVVGETAVGGSIQVVQGLLFNSLVWGYHVPTGGWGAYTYYDRVLEMFDKTVDFKRALRDNEEGNILAYRIDAKHAGGAHYDVELKELRSRKYKLNTKDYLFVSGSVLLEIYMGIIKRLQSGKVYEVVQGEKVRYVTTDTKVLAEYSDDSNFVSSLSIDLQPLKGWVYAPVLGAPSTSTGVTRVDILLVDKFQEAKSWNVEKAQDGLESMVERSVLYSYAQDIIENDLTKDKRALAKVGVGADDCTVGELYTRLLNLPPKVQKSIVGSTRVKYSGNSELVRKFIKGYEVVHEDIISAEKLESILNRGLYKVTFSKSDGSITSRLVTRDERVLEACYGSDWFVKYSTESEKKKRFVRLLNNEGVPWEDAAQSCGMPTSIVEESDQDSRNRILSDLMENQRALSKPLKGYVYGKEVKIVSDNVPVDGLGLSIAPNRVIRIARVG